MTIYNKPNDDYTQTKHACAFALLFILFLRLELDASEVWRSLLTSALPSKTGGNKVIPVKHPFAIKNSLPS